MSFFKTFAQAQRMNKLKKLEKKRAEIRMQRDALKVKAVQARDEYEACLREIKTDMQSNPPGTVVSPGSIPSGEAFGEPGKK